jgi:hypothetical protein
MKNKSETDDIIADVTRFVSQKYPCFNYVLNVFHNFVNDLISTWVTFGPSLLMLLR